MLSVFFFSYFMFCWKVIQLNIYTKLYMAEQETTRIECYVKQKCPINGRDSVLE